MDKRQNKYDENSLFSNYSQKERDAAGLNLDWAWEWPYLQKMLPNLSKKRVLDLGCGSGWQCKYAAEQGAEHVVGVEISNKLLEDAKRMNASNNIEYIQSSIEDFDYSPNEFDVVISSMALHYVDDFENICRHINRTLKSNGQFTFSVEHPSFTASGTRDWVPLQGYFNEGERESVFLGEKLKKFHRMLSSYIMIPTRNGFLVTDVCEPCPKLSSVEKGIIKPDRLQRPSKLLVNSIKTC
jgi:2-polyprenyl-3-methyl-5-hydroxy-6-metoxy-1,4-benzoquinol methylase